jgi:hypothetical protein
MLYVTIIGSVQRVPLMGIGIMPKPAPLSTIVIGDCNTGITDKNCEDKLISKRIAECAKEVKNHGKFVSCVARLANELKREGIITKEDQNTYRGALRKRGYLKRHATYLLWHTNRRQALYEPSMVTDNSGIRHL